MKEGTATENHYESIEILGIWMDMRQIHIIIWIIYVLRPLATKCMQIKYVDVDASYIVILLDSLGTFRSVDEKNPWSKDATMLNKSIQCYYMVNKCKQTWQWKLPILGRSSNWWTFSCHDSLWITETSLAFKWPRLGRLQSPKALTDARGKTSVSWPEKVD